MTEIIEDGKTYVVSGSYPDTPYVKYLKTSPAAPVENPLTVIQEKLDEMAKEIATISAQTKITAVK